MLPILDEISGQMTSTVSFAPSARSAPYPEGKWSVLPRLELSLNGVVERRDVATALRERLLDGGLYQVKTEGPDTEKKFDLRLVTANVSPQAAEDSRATKPKSTEGKR